MRSVHLTALCALTFSLALIAGCGSDTGGPAQPAADLNEIEQYLADNPDQDTDDLYADEEADMEDDAE